MARASVNLTCKKCGKEFTHIRHNVDNRSDADRYEDWARATIDSCPECYKAAQAEVRAAEKEKRHAREFKTAQDWENSLKFLPELKGSEEQVAWATVIRHDIMHNAIGGHGLKPEYLGEKWEELVREHSGDDIVNAVAHVRNWALPLVAQDSAKWWIDNRETKGMDTEYILVHWGDIYNASLAQIAKDAKIAELKASEPRHPQCLKKIFAESPKGATWNCTVYGRAKYNNLRIYVDNKEFSVTREEAAELEAWVAAWEAWKKELKELKGDQK